MCKPRYVARKNYILRPNRACREYGDHTHRLEDQVHNSESNILLVGEIRKLTEVCRRKISLKLCQRACGRHILNAKVYVIKAATLCHFLNVTDGLGVKQKLGKSNQRSSAHTGTAKVSHRTVGSRVDHCRSGSHTDHQGLGQT